MDLRATDAQVTEKWSCADAASRALLETAVRKPLPTMTAPDLLANHSLLMLDEAGTIRSWTERLRRMFGYEAHEVLGLHVSVFFPERNAREELSTFELGIAARSGYFAGGGLRERRDGTLFDARVHIVALHDSLNLVCGFMKFIQESQLHPRRGRASSPLARSSVAHGPAPRLRKKRGSPRPARSIEDGIITTDSCGTITSINHFAEAMTGWSSRDALGQPVEMIFTIVDEQTRFPVRGPVSRALDDEQAIERETGNLLIGRDGSHHAIEDSCILVRNQDRRIIGTVLEFRRCAARLQAVEWQRQVERDGLTGLPNRLSFEHSLSHVLEYDATGSASMLLHLDLQHFTVINRVCGRLAGDEVLRRVARLIEGSVRQGDTVARIGGDEFGILLVDCDLPQASRLAESLLMALHQQVLVWGDHCFRIDARIGITSLADRNRTAGELLEAAGSRVDR